MTRFAAYDDMSIYGVGDSPEGAIAEARLDAREPAAQFKTAPISDELADWIARNGWHGPTRSFEVGQDGYLVDITDKEDFR